MIKKLLLTFLTGVGLGVYIPPMTTTEYFINTDAINFSTTEDKSVKVRVTSYHKEKEPVKLNFSISYGGVSKQIVEESWNSTYSRSRVVNIFDYMMPVITKELTGTFLLTNTETNAEILKITFLIPHKKSNQKINVNSYMNDNYAFKGRTEYVRIADNKVITFQDEYQFANLATGWVIDTYNFIDFSNCYFYFNAAYPYTYHSATLTIKDNANLFPYLQNSSKNVIFPLKIEQNANICSFSYDEDIYVNEETLDMSFNASPGFVKTEKIFLPRNKKSILSSTDIKLQIVFSGRAAYTIDLTTSFIFGKSLVGSCQDSTYCVSGGVYRD